MRIFISYSRVDKPTAQAISRYLRNYSIWFDERLFIGMRWWDEILDQLDWSDVFIYLISSASIKSQYCRKEFRIARDKGLPILPIIIEAGVKLPPEVSVFHHLDFSQEITSDGMANLFNALSACEQKTAHLPPRAPKAAAPDPETEMSRNSPVPADSARAFTLGFDAFISGSVEYAVMVFEQLKARGFAPEYQSIDLLLAHATQMLADQQQNHQRDIEYERIRQLMVHKGRMIEIAAESFWRFHLDFPAHDPDGFALVLIQAGHPPPAGLQTPLIASARNSRPTTYTLPSLYWMPIPEGGVCIGVGQTGRERASVMPVPAFDISRYEVTNAQFQAFVDDPKGYSSLEWWDFWTLARVWKRSHPQLLASEFSGAMHPRANVTWYEAMAFTRWLSARTGEAITLPLLVQAQRAARGDDERLYPWGNDFDLPMANTAEGKLHATTSVDFYERAASPFGVVDMAGNVWEWCLNAHYLPPTLEEQIADEQTITRSVIGGSYKSECTAARIEGSMLLKPEHRYSTIGFRLVRLHGED